MAVPKDRKAIKLLETNAVSAPAPPNTPNPPPDPQEKKRKEEGKDTNDPNLANPRLFVNRACIYERHLPGDAYITAHIQRLQHGYFSCSTISDKDYDHVDFVAVTFVFHSPRTHAHRFMAATIRASVSGNRKLATSGQLQTQPRFLIHAPRLLYGAVSPETLQWRFGLAGSLGIADFPVSASVTPSGGMRGLYRRYEMMRIQGSARTLRSPLGRQFDVESGEIVWSLEENALQKSGLPREFTFAMLVQKPRAESRVKFSLEIDPVIQSWYGNYPAWWLSLPMYQPVKRRPVDFRREIGQRFEPKSSSRSKKGKFNFATLESSFDDYVHMPGRRFTSGTTPDGRFLGDDREFRSEVTRDMLLAGPQDPSFSRRYTDMPSGNLATQGNPAIQGYPAIQGNPGIQMPSTLNVRLQLESVAVDREKKKRRRMSNPEKVPVAPRYRIPLRRSRSGDILYCMK